MDLEDFRLETVRACISSFSVPNQHHRFKGPPTNLSVLHVVVLRVTNPLLFLPPEVHMLLVWLTLFQRVSAGT